MDRVRIGSGNGLSTIQRQAIIKTNAGTLSIGPLETNFMEILIKIQNFSLTKMHMKISPVKWRPFCSGGNELIHKMSSKSYTFKNYCNDSPGPMS